MMWKRLIGITGSRARLVVAAIAATLAMAGAFAVLTPSPSAGLGTGWFWCGWFTSPYWHHRDYPSDTDPEDMPGSGTYYRVAPPKPIHDDQVWIGDTCKPLEGVGEKHTEIVS